MHLRAMWAMLKDRRERYQLAIGNKLEDAWKELMDARERETSTQRELYHVDTDMERMELLAQLCDFSGFNGREVIRFALGGSKASVGRGS